MLKMREVDAESVKTMHYAMSRSLRQNACDTEPASSTLLIADNAAADHV